MLKKLIHLTLLGIVLMSENAWADAQDDIVRRIFENVTGVPIDRTDPRFSSMKAAVVAGNLRAAASTATEDANFYNVTLVNWSSRMFAKEESPLATLTDFQALMIGTVRDGLDARGILTGDYLYYGASQLAGNPPSLANNNHYTNISSPAVNLKTELARRSPQWPGFPEAAGIFTTRGWAQSHYDAGTNRRSTEYAFREFLCAPISQWKDAGLPVGRIRRDVDRAPGGNPATFQSLCRNCHAPMDGMSGAFARLDFDGQSLTHAGTGVAPKFNRNEDVYPEGYETRSDSWINYATMHHNEAFGWRGPTEGTGVAAFGLMIANSQGFKQCMTRRAFREVCHRDPNGDDQTEVLRLSDLFETESYNLKGLFQNVAISPRCM